MVNRSFFTFRGWKMSVNHETKHTAELLVPVSCLLYYTIFFILFSGSTTFSPSIKFSVKVEVCDSDSSNCTCTSVKRANSFFHTHLSVVLIWLHEKLIHHTGLFFFFSFLFLFIIYNEDSVKTFDVCFNNYWSVLNHWFSDPVWLNTVI